MIKSNFVKMNVQYLTKTSAKSEQVQVEAPATSNTEPIVQDTGSKKINLDGAKEALANKNKEIAEKIKSFTEELKKLKIPNNATKVEINNFISQVNNMRKEVGELYHQLEQGVNYNNVIYNTRTKEHDEAIHAYREFNDLALSKLEEAKEILAKHN